MSGVITFNVRCHNIIQNANLAIISHITKQKTKKSKNPQGKQSPKQVPCAAALPQPQPATQPAFQQASRSPPCATAAPHVPQQSPSPSHSSPPVPATAAPPVPATTVPQSQPQLSPMLRCHRSHPASIPASKPGPPYHGTAAAPTSHPASIPSSEVPRATAVPWPQNPWPQNPLQKVHTQKKITKNLHSKKNSSNFASLFQKMESTQFGM